MKIFKYSNRHLVSAVLFCITAFVAVTGFKSMDYIIRGKIMAPDGTVIKMAYDFQGKIYSDSTVTNNNELILTGKFPEPVLCTLSNSKNQQVKVIVAQNATMVLTGTIEKFYHMTVDGGEENKLFELFKEKSVNITADYRNELKASGETIHNKMSTAYIRFHERIDSLTLSFVKEHPNATAASLAIINSHMNSTDVMKASNCYSYLSESGKKNQYALRIKSFIDTDQAMSAGNLVPELLLNDLNGSRFKLSEQKGKYILLDFWASWCLPCRQEHPLLRKLHLELKNENIIFVSISMDTNDKSWRQAISNDHLMWTQLNDSSGMSGQIARRFGIKALPFNCIIDPEGKILGAKIRGKELENLMTKLFKK